MNSSDLLDPVLQTYNTARDCLKVARRSVSAKHGKRINRTGFERLTVQQAEEIIDTSKSEIEDFAIIGFWARFVRYLVEYSQIHAKALALQNPVAFSASLQEKLNKEIEYWKTVGMRSKSKSIEIGSLIEIQRKYHPPRPMPNRRMIYSLRY